MSLSWAKLTGKDSERNAENQKVGTRLSLGLVCIVGVMAFSSSFMILRTDKMGQKLNTINQVYVPSLKHLNVLLGKFMSHRRSTDQFIQFNKWGSKSFELGHPRINMKRTLEDDLRRLNRFSGEKNEILVKELLSQISDVADREPLRLAELAVLVKNHQIADAARIYMLIKQDQSMVTHSINTVIREMELAVDELQMSVDRELRNTTVVILVLFALSVLCTLAVGFRMRSWLLPLMEWRLAAGQMARHIATSGFEGLKDKVKLPKVTRSTPAEIVLLTRELGNMATTVIEHEKTIHHQKVKLENLNAHLKNQNERLRVLGSLNERILNAMTAGVIVLDANGKAEQFNHRFCEVFAIAPETVLGRSAAELLAGFSSELLKQWVAVEENTVQWRVKTDNGQVYNVHVQLLPSHHDGVGGRVLSFEDVTALVVSEDRLAHAERLVLAGQMSAQVAHEVRNPLNSIMLQLEMLEEDIAPEHSLESNKRISQIALQVERLERLTRHYLNVGKSMGLDQGRCTSVDIHDLLERTLDFCSAEIQARGVMVDLRLESKASVVTVDADRMTQVFLNLIQNSLEAMEGAAIAHPILSIRTFDKNNDGHHEVVVSVQDNGPGLSRQVQPRLFEPFVTSKASGHGLGLSTARQACLDHGGDLKFVEQSQGACFEMRLPC